MSFVKRLFFVLITSLLALDAFALESPFANLERVVRYLRISEKIQSSQIRRPVKIAVLDNGFKNFELEIGKTLPRNTVFHAGPVAVPETQLEPHGTVMAQIVTGVLDQASGGTFEYELHLYSAFGYSNLNAAVQDLVARKVDVVLYSQVWEYGGFGEGRGFINQLVNKATSAGVLWINAAGNFAKGTYQARITPLSDGQLDLPGDNESVRVRCDNSKAGKCHIRAVLSWNDFNDDVNVGTDKDLDFELTDQQLNVVRSSVLQQKKNFPEGTQGVSKYSREIIDADVAPGTYFLRAKARSNNFGHNDQLRITVSGNSVVLVDRTQEADPLNPADNRSVITVGATDSDLSSSSASGSKPEVRLASMLELANGDAYKGSSNSAAMFAAVAAVHSSLVPGLKKDALLKRWNNPESSSTPRPTPTPSPAPIPQPQPEPQPAPGPQPQPAPELPPVPAQPAPQAQPGRGLPMNVLDFASTGPGCFLQTQIKDAPISLQPLLRDGAIAVKTSAGKKVFITVDPLTIIYGVQRRQANDMVVATHAGYFIYPREEQDELPGEFYEVVQIPAGEFICTSDGRHPRQ